MPISNQSAPVGITTIAQASFRGVRPSFGWIGDSKAINNSSLGGLSALFWVIARDYAADIKWDERTYANGGMVFAVGGTTTAQMLSTQVPQMQARTPDILWVESGNNDNWTTLADVTTSLNNVVATITAGFAAGVKLVILIPYAPRSSSVLTSTAVQLTLAFNEMLRDYARNNPNVVFIDNPPLLTDPAYADYRPSGDGGVTGSSSRPYGAMSSDGLHNSTNSARATATLLANHLKAFCRERYPRVVSQGDVYDSALNPRGNQFGSKGMMVGTNGTLNSVANAGVAAGWQITTANGLVATPTLVTGTVGRLKGFPVQQIDFSGTTTGSANCDVICQGVYQNWPVGSSFMGETVIRVLNPGNFRPPEVNFGLISETLTVGGATTSGANTILPTGIDETYFIFTSRAGIPRPTSGSTNPGVTIRINVPLTSLVASGTVQIGLCGVFAVAP